MRLVPRRLLPRYWPIHEKYRDPSSPPRVVAITGFPRSGTTLAKRFLGDVPSRLEIAAYGGARAAWGTARAQEPGRCVVAKRTRFLEDAPEIDREYGNAFWFLCMVRDPRDVLLSLDRTAVHPELPRDGSTVRAWGDRMEAFLAFAKRRRRRGDHVRFLRYEELVRRPERSKRAFLEWLAIDAADEVAGSSYDQRSSAFVNGTSTTEDPEAHRNAAVHTGSLRAWTERAADPRFASVSHGPTQRVMARFGYVPHGRGGPCAPDLLLALEDLDGLTAGPPLSS